MEAQMPRGSSKLRTTCPGPAATVPKSTSSDTIGLTVPDVLTQQPSNSESCQGRRENASIAETSSKATILHLLLLSAYGTLPLCTLELYLPTSSNISTHPQPL